MLSDVQNIFAPLDGVKRLLVAVSGGPDSMALLHLASDWRLAGGPEIYAATVDHALRKEARDEAEQVAQWCTALSVPHKILTWQGDKPTTRLQERAREARYELLFAYAQEIGAEMVATAHHADDQAETILFRLLRGSGIAGLAGMELLSARGGLKLARPLLPFTKAQLIALCDARQQSFIRDPSNEDPRFARTQLRALMGDLGQQGLDREALLRLARRAARMAALADHALGRFRVSLGAPQPGRFTVAFGQLRDAPEEVWLRLMGEEIARIGQANVRLEQLETLAEALTAAASRHEPYRTTLGGVLVDLDMRGTLTLTPEPPRRG